MGKHLKILGLSFLALAGVMAVSASAAQANWLLLKSGVSVSSLNLVGSSTENDRLLVDNGIEIECGGSSDTATVSLNAPFNTILTGTATVTFNECEELNFGEVCETHSTGAKDGTIVTSGSGVGGMLWEGEVYLEAGHQLLTIVEFSSFAFECPLEEINGITTGEVKIAALNVLQDTKSHVAHIETKSLEFGEEEAEIDNETGGHVILGSIGEEEGHTFAVHLMGL